jgi:hypothetical protein
MYQVGSKMEKTSQTFGEVSWACVQLESVVMVNQTKQLIGHVLGWRMWF